MKNYIYGIVDSKGNAVSDVAFSREEARELQRMYNRIYNVKHKIVRYTKDKVVR